MGLRLLLSFAAVPLLCAQDGPWLPKVVRIVRDELKPGKAAAYEKAAGASARSFGRAKFPVPYLAMSAVSGTPEVWMVEAHASVFAIETARAALLANTGLRTEIEGFDTLYGDLRDKRQVWIAQLRPELSHRPADASAAFPTCRYVSVGIFKLFPGREREFMEAARSIAANFTKAKDDRPYVMYQVISGSSAGTFVTLSPIPSLKSFDQSADRSRQLRDAIGDEGLRIMNQQIAQAVWSSDALLYALEPTMSYPPPAFAAADPFWKR